MSLSSSSARRLVGVAALLVAAAAGAQDRPASRDEAQAVIERAKQETAEVQRRYEQAQRECEKGLFVNPCRDQARTERDLQLRGIREREVAARDALRRLDAEERAKARMQRSAEPAAESKSGGSVPAGRAPAAAGRAAPPTAAPRAVDPSQQEVAAEKKRAEAANRKVEAEQRAAEHAAERERREAERAEKAAQAPGGIERYQERQRTAEARAEEKKRIAEENRKRREKRAEERAAGQEKAGSSAPQ